MATRITSFGEFAKKKRLEARLGLREAARKMSISAAYLSRVENDVDPPSAELIMKMSVAYDCDVEELNAAAKRPSVAATTRGRSIALSEELRALYRIGGTLSAAEVEEMIRHVLEKRNMSPEEIERELASLRSELPRIRSSHREGLLAADIKPRYLSKRAITSMAYRLLSEHGLDASEYLPPTPIETLVEEIDGIRYEIQDLPSKNGEPIVLGLTKRNFGTERQIVINSTLADSERRSDVSRFNFTLAHELFHAIEHLALFPGGAPAGMMRKLPWEAVYVERGTFNFKASRAERAVDIWAKGSTAHRLFTNEDWREWQANTFAAALLMPEWSLRKAFERRFGTDNHPAAMGVNLRQVGLEIAGATEFGGQICEESLADVYGVSRQAMAIRLIDLGMISVGGVG